MTKDENQMPIEARSTNDERFVTSDFGHWSFLRHLDFVTGRRKCPSLAASLAMRVAPQSALSTHSDRGVCGGGGGGGGGSRGPCSPGGGAGGADFFAAIGGGFQRITVGEAGAAAPGTGGCGNARSPARVAEGSVSPLPR